MVSRGTPKIHQKSLKIHFGTFQGPSVCICDPLDCKMVPKWCPRTSKWIQNGHLGTLKGVKNQQNPIIRYIVNRFILFVFFNGFQSWKPVFSIPANPCSLQISSQLVARGAGGRGEALRSAAPGRRPDAGRLQSLCRFSPLQGSPEKESPSPAGHP